MPSKFRTTAVVITGLILASTAQARFAALGNFMSSALPSGLAAPAKPFAPGTTYSVCLVPDGASCEKLLADTINGARQSILVQAYSFTSQPISDALVAAKARGVDIRVIVDKSQLTEKYTVVPALTAAGIPVVVDSVPAIAHNKVMIFDQQSVFTGSFNFTSSAQKRNAENGLLLKGDPEIVRAYTENWNTRVRQSNPF